MPNVWQADRSGTRAARQRGLGAAAQDPIRLNAPTGKRGQPGGPDPRGRGPERAWGCLRSNTGTPSPVRGDARQANSPHADRAVTRDRFAPKLSSEHELGGQAMERGLSAPLSPHEEVTFRRIALGISEAKHLLARDVAYLIRLHLVDQNEGRLKLTDLGRERYQGRHLDARDG